MKKAVRVARTLNLIAGDGETNVLHLNTLDYEMWDEVTGQEEWDDIYNGGFKRLKKLRPKGSKDYREFQFDVLRQILLLLEILKKLALLTIMI